MKNNIYLDYNASAPLRPESRKALLTVLDTSTNAALNPSAVHNYGRQARKFVEDARMQLSTCLNIPPAQILFNSGATETNNTILRFFKELYPDETILVSAIEHPSVLQACENLETIPATPQGLVNLTALEDRLKKEPKVSLVSIMAVNNETGVIQDVSKISRIVHSHGALFHCDAAQAFGKIELDIPETGADFLSLSAHKIGAPQGVGALILGLCGITPILLRGGGQEKSARAGTENTAGIAAFAAAATAAHKDLMPQREHLSKMREAMESQLLNISPEIIIHGQDVPRAPNTSFFSLPGIPSETMMMALDLEGIALSNGSACSSGRVKPSNVLINMGQSPEIASSALRVSTGWATTQNDIDAFLNVWEKLAKRWKK
ncbi:MAG: cysteine desulfurase [Alphaproteobacteria bacterium]|nr:cysteine desulfurase [Alphaproteobacteria bacterium]